MTGYWQAFIGGCAWFCLGMLAPLAQAERAPVLKQIDVPHDYYFREMYLPQLTSGPSSLAFMPDGERLVYSMQGSLWLQAIDAGVARQLTAGPGYDYQPDVSPDGRRVVFVRYVDDALNLYELTLADGSLRALTTGDDVNVEPRYSPDGQRLAFVSTRGSGRFHLFVGSIDADAFEAAPLLPERRTAVPRYYYSQYDHELSPSWSPDGRELLYVSNPDRRYGSGALWKRALDGGEAVLLRDEETTWRARPDWSPDGKRIAYASYLGRQWHQLWLTTVAGDGDPLPFSYGDYDISSPRWSPDGERIAYIANEHGGLELRVQEVIGGRVTVVTPAQREYLRPMTTLTLRVTDADGEPLPARVSVTGADGRRYAPADAWLHADDSLDREHDAFERQYFHLDGEATLKVPAGNVNVVAWHGLEREIGRVSADATADEELALQLALPALPMPPAWRNMVSGDVHVHMNYGGHYRNTPARLLGQAAAEDLDVVFNLVVNKEQRIPDIRAFRPDPDPASTANGLLVHGQEFHTSYWGHLGLLGLDSHFLLPDYSAYANTALASPHPDNVTAAELAHAQSALVGYVHPFLSVPDPAGGELTNQLPVSAALGRADFYEVVGFADHRASAEVWHRLLNCGMRLTAAGGTDAMANYASLRGPVGLNRTYVRVEGQPATLAERQQAWLAALAAGRSLATNGPLLGFEVDGRGPGETLPAGQREVSYRGFLRSIVPVSHFELVKNGDVVRRFESGPGKRSVDIEGSIDVADGDWLLLRAWNESAVPEIFDYYPYATTNPVFVDRGGALPSCGADADYFIAWIDNVIDNASRHPDYNNDREREIVLGHLEAARAVFGERR